MLGHWGYASGFCRGYTFKIHADKVEYLAAMEPLGSGRILGVTAKNSGLLTIETILGNKGKFLSLWPSVERGGGVMGFGTGPTGEASMVELCEVVQW